MNKYRNIKTTIDGITFASKKEALRYSSLKMLFDAGKIHDFIIHPVYPIIIDGRKICNVILDFQYRTDDGKLWVEDVKGGKATRTPLSRLKHKLVEVMHNIEVIIV